MIDIDQIFHYVFINLQVKFVKTLSKIFVILSNKLFILFELFPDMLQELSKVFWLVYDKLVNDSLMDFNRWELVRIALIDYSCQCCKMFRNFWCTLLKNEVILGTYFFKELLISIDVFK